MCGFSGILSSKKNNLKELLSKSIAKLHHRGPDGQGIWCEHGIGLGHVRLSVHDLSIAGHQPMFSADGRYVIVFNGEIYNYLELKKDLINKGLIFNSNTDTEVLVNAIVIWGIEETLKRSVGMFAFAVWDRQEKRLYLARDRFGEKPLYYGKLDNDVVFASELKAISVNYKADLTIDRDVLATYMRYGYVPAPYSIYKNIFKLEPGNYLIIEPDLTIQKKCYWSSIEVAQQGLANPLEISFKEASLQLEAKLKKTLSRQMLADVPLGAFLSGGVDSSLVVALMQSLSSNPVKTFSIGFYEKQYNEAHFAKDVAKHLKTEHTELYVSAKQALDVIPKLSDIYDEPFADSSQIPTFLVSQLTRRHVTVSLSGDAGDELFGGYNRYLFADKINRLFIRPWLPNAIFNSIPRNFLDLFNYLPQKKVTNLTSKLKKMQDVLRQSNNSFPLFYCNLCSQGHDLVLNAKEHKHLLEEKHTALFKEFGAVLWMMLIDANTYLTDDILVKVDRAAMAVSLETRVLFLDHDIYEFAWKLPLKFKIQKSCGKLILRDILHRYVPKELIERPKMGFGVPYGEWLREDLKEWASILLDSNKIAQQGYLNPEKVQYYWAMHQSKKHNHEAILWNILIFQLWLQKND